MAKRLLILGGGTAGTMMANHLRKRLPRADWQMTVVDRDNEHHYQPGYLFLVFNMNTEDEIVRPRTDFFPDGVEFIQAEVEEIIPADHQVKLLDDRVLDYDILIVATGTRIAPEETPGMAGAEWHKSIHEFYTLDGARALRDKLAGWKGGKLVVHVAEMPIKCPVAPLEFACLADWFLAEHGTREQTTITYVTPLSGAFTKPLAAKKFAGLLDGKGIHLVADFAVESVDPAGHELKCYDGRTVPYDLLVTIPVNMGSPAVINSGLGDDLGFMPTAKHTLQSRVDPDVFVLGDATNLPTSKAGSVAHFESETLADNILRYINGEPLKEEFDGHANCFIESGHGKAMLIDFNYDIEPHEGGFPFSFGPMRLLGESRINHWGKMAFRHVYWNMLLKARPLPGITRNKKAPRAAAARSP